MERGAPRATVHGVTESDMTEQLCGGHRSRPGSAYQTHPPDLDTEKQGPGRATLVVMGQPWWLHPGGTHHTTSCVDTAVPGAGLVLGLSTAPFPAPFPKPDFPACLVILCTISAYSAT